MWPVLAGIEPVLGEGISGYFIDPDGTEFSWSFSEGYSLLDGTPLTHVSGSYKLTNPNPKVAVLLDNGVASSGEAIAISFIGRENTKSFGSSTCGMSTANDSFTLSDSSVLILTVSYMADRKKHIYGTPVNPDMTSGNETIIQDDLPLTLSFMHQVLDKF